jgi:hypothetical protein
MYTYSKYRTCIYLISYQKSKILLTFNYPDSGIGVPTCLYLVRVSGGSFLY